MSASKYRESMRATVVHDLPPSDEFEMYMARFAAVDGLDRFGQGVCGSSQEMR